VRGTLPDKVVFQREVDTIDGYRSATYEVGYTDSADGITFDGDPTEVTVSEVVEPKALDPEQVTVDPLTVAKFRLLVASTRT
jgi:hypothetical protein